MLMQYLILLTFFIIYILSSNLNDYGSFDLIITKFDQCKGPKRKDCCTAVVKVNNDSTLLYNLTVRENTTPTKGKILAMSNGKEFLRLQMKKPCDHLFLRPLFQTIMNVTKSCIILKGNYIFNIDIQEIAQNYYGGTFLFGNWTFKSIFYSDECNFSCSIVEVEFAPKNRTNTIKSNNSKTKI